MKKLLAAVIVLFLFALSCKKETIHNHKDNPYDDWTYDYPKDDDTLADPDPKSFAGIYKHIFRPSCANSGCHDGNFEPDFRNLESTYASLINSKVTKPHADGLYPYRVVPGNADASMLIIRMIEDLNGNSGIMPLSVDPGSDWFDKKQEYIDNVKAWINDGAKDVFGNSPQPVDMRPVLNGFVVTRKNETTPLSRTSAFGAVRIPENVNEIDVWFAFEDDNTQSQNLLYNKVRMGINLPTLENETEKNLAIIPGGLTTNGWASEPVIYTHKITLQKSELGVSGDVIWFRAYVQDASNPVHAYPSENAIFRLKTYCSARLE
jgi:hypothetical protein